MENKNSSINGFTSKIERLSDLNSNLNQVYKNLDGILERLNPAMNEVVNIDDSSKKDLNGLMNLLDEGLEIYSNHIDNININLSKINNLLS